MHLRIGVLLMAAAVISPPLPAQDSPADQVKKIMDETQANYDKVLEQYKAETDNAKRSKILTEGRTAVVKESAARLQEVADKHPQTTAAAEALALICQSGSRMPELAEQVAAAKERLLADFLNDPSLVPALSIWSQDDATLEKFVKESTCRDVQGVALYMQMSKAKGREVTAANVDAVKPLMDRIVKDFGDVELRYPGGITRGTLSTLVENDLFAFENLQIGKVAPDISGEDIDGVEFKLSEYRGKVVVIDFWGDW